MGLDLVTSFSSNNYTIRSICVLSVVTLPYYLWHLSQNFYFYSLIEFMYRAINIGKYVQTDASGRDRLRARLGGGGGGVIYSRN